MLDLKTYLMRIESQKIYIDRGSEFYNADVKPMLQTHNVNMYSTFSEMKASIIERFNRTLKK